MRTSRSLDRVAVMFGDDNLVANAGLIVPATLVQHLELEARFNAKVHERNDKAPGGRIPRRVELVKVQSQPVDDTGVNGHEFFAVVNQQAQFT